jgi:hypothetical protein
MNPKGVNDLDPKLRETYERVMGTSLQPVAPAANNPTQAPQQPAQSVPQPVLKTEAVAPEPPVQAATPVAPPPAPEAVAPAQVFKADDDPFKEVDPPPAEIITNNAVVSPKLKKKSKLKPVLFVFGGLIFFVVYAVVWAVLLGLIKLS